MTFQAPTPPILSLIPENAPFSAEQRAWLNGFFAGFVVPQGAGAPPVGAPGMIRRCRSTSGWGSPLASR